MPHRSLHPLAFGSRIARTFTSCREWQDTVSRSNWTAEYDTIGDSRLFGQRVAQIRTSQLVATAITHTPMRTKVTSRAGLQVFVPVSGGGIESRVNGQRFQVRPRDGFLLAPDGERVGSGISRSVVVLDIDPEQLKRTAIGMMGGETRAIERFDFSLPHRLQTVVGRINLSEAMSHLFGLLDASCESPVCMRNAGVDDSIYRLLAMAVWPQELCDAPGGVETTPGSTISTIAEYVIANLKERLTMADLERITGYSARTIQNAFRSQVGVGPMEWVRARKFEAIRKTLLSSPPSAKLKGIVADHGVPLAHFAERYREYFGERPSDTLRR